MIVLCCDTECNAGYIILEQKEEFIMFQLQVVRYNFKQNAKSKVQIMLTISTIVPIEFFGNLRLHLFRMKTFVN